MTSWLQDSTNKLHTRWLSYTDYTLRKNDSNVVLSGEPWEVLWKTVFCLKNKQVAKIRYTNQNGLKCDAECGSLEWVGSPKFFETFWRLYEIKTSFESSAGVQEN